MQSQHVEFVYLLSPVYPRLCAAEGRGAMSNMTIASCSRFVAESVNQYYQMNKEFSSSKKLPYMQSMPPLKRREGPLQG